MLFSDPARQHNNHHNSPLMVKDLIEYSNSYKTGNALRRDDQVSRKKKMDQERPRKCEMKWRTLRQHGDYQPDSNPRKPTRIFGRFAISN